MAGQPGSTTTPGSESSYFINPRGQAMVCSGVVVGRNLIMTAGHCVYTGSAGAPGSGWNPRFLFVPGKVGRSNPYGTFTGKNSAVYDTYYKGADGIAPMPGLDYAFVKLNPRAGHSVGDLVGWDGVTWGNYTAYRSIGYPSEGWFLANGGGNYPWFTRSNRTGSYRWGTTPYYDVRIANRANGGASGGPWIVSIWRGRVCELRQLAVRARPRPEQAVHLHGRPGPDLGSEVTDDLRQGALELDRSRVGGRFKAHPARCQERVSRRASGLSTEPP